MPTQPQIETLAELERAAGITDPDAYWAEVADNAPPGETLEEAAARGLLDLHRRAEPDDVATLTAAGTCRTGRHVWLNAADRARCCNGYRRELRVGALETGDDPALATRVPLDTVAAWWVWVPDAAAQRVAA